MTASLDVEYKYSLFTGKHPAYWNINGDSGKITFYLGEIWGISQSRAKPDIDGWDEMDSFIDELLYYDLSERICLERAHEKIRLKGGRCNPCCVQYFTQLALYPHAWKTIQKKQGREPEDAKCAGLVRLPSAIALSKWVYDHTDFGGVCR
jgi:hypothetical protein